MLALIDGDIILYRVGFSTQKETEQIACIRAGEMVHNILADVGATEYQVWLSDSLDKNYRYQIEKNYKITRQSVPKPIHYHAIKLYLKYEWGAQIAEGQEADDALGIEQTKASETLHNKGQYPSVICSIDKDLLQVPGLHYNFVRKENTQVDYLQGMRYFYSQFLIGDRVDDIEGIYGLGPKKTETILKSCTNENEMFEKVRYYYKDDERLLKNGRLLWVRRYPNQTWNFPESIPDTMLLLTTNLMSTKILNTSLTTTKEIVEDLVQDEEGDSSATSDGHSVGEPSPVGDVL